MPAQRVRGARFLLVRFTVAGSGAAELDEGLTTVLAGLRTRQLSHT